MARVILAVSRVTGFRRPALVAPAARAAGTASTPPPGAGGGGAPIDVDLLWEETWGDEPWAGSDDTVAGPSPLRPLALTPAAVAGAYAAARRRPAPPPFVDALA